MKPLIKMHSMAFNLLGLCFVILACGTAQQIPETTPNPTSCEVLISDEFGNTPEGKIVIARDPETARQEYSRINMTRKPGYEMPDIDYRENALVFVFLEEKASGGYGIEWLDCAQHNQGISVILKAIEPEEGAYVTTAITSPFMVIKVPAAEDIKIQWK